MHISYMLYVDIPFYSSLLSCITPPSLPPFLPPSLSLLPPFLSSLSYSQGHMPSTGTGNGFHNLPQGSDQQIASFLDSLAPPRSHSSIGLPLVPTEFGQCTIKGNLYRKERLRQWSKCHCLIRNSFFECHKSSASSGSKPLIKLFLPGSSVTSLHVRTHLCIHIYSVPPYMYMYSTAQN